LSENYVPVVLEGKKQKKPQIAVIFKDLMTLYTSKASSENYDFESDYTLYSRQEWINITEENLLKKNQVGRIPKQAKGTRD